jgi:hypothetical protein
MGILSRKLRGNALANYEWVSAVRLNNKEMAAAAVAARRRRASRRVSHAKQKRVIADVDPQGDLVKRQKKGAVG